LKPTQRFHLGLIFKIFGRGPSVIPESMIADFFKYETSSKAFKKIGSKSLTYTTDAISLDPTKMKR
jgi:hypothetical protein